MIIEDQKPPNFQEIKNYFSEKLLDKYKPVFAYGEIIYNPYKIEIPEDIQYHESVHLKQQREFSSPDLWWSKYLMDREFRKDQEIEAFSAQWRWVKPHLPSQGVKDALSEFAEILASPLYDLNLTQSQAETKIRLYDRQ